MKKTITALTWKRPIACRVVRFLSRLVAFRALQLTTRQSCFDERETFTVLQHTPDNSSQMSKWNQNTFPCREGELSLGAKSPQSLQGAHWSCHQAKSNVCHTRVLLPTLVQRRMEICRHMWQKSKCSGAVQTVAVHTEKNGCQNLQQSL